MKWTEEQLAIFEATGDLKINAVAGSGKTTTVMELARRAESAGQRVTYIAFNKKVKEEAAVRAVEMGLSGFRAVTAHGLAYGEVMQRMPSAVVAHRGHKPTDYLRFLDGFRSAADRLAAGAHVDKFVRYFCNSGALKVAELDYLDVVGADDADFAAEHLEAIALGTRRALGAMHKGNLAMTPDFYLKLYALSTAIVPGDVLLFDEAQDASPCMLQVVMRSPGRKVVVGDRHQQIYGWRHAVNSLEAVDFKELPLSASFRFPGEVAQLARDVVRWKQGAKIQLKGRGKATRSIQSSVVLARTNTGLFEAALAYIASRERVGLEPKIEIAGNLHALLSAEQGGSVYDLLNLKLGKTDKVKDEGLATLSDWADCQAYARESGDPSLRALTRLVDEHGKRLPGMIQRLKRSAERTGDVEMTFSTVHQSKGLEWDSVVVWSDFAAQTQLHDLDNADEEINILYVAVTRARALVFVPDAVFDETKHDMAGEPRARVITTYPVDGEREPERRGARWSDAEDAWLRTCFYAGLPLATIARLFDRTYTSIKARLTLQELIEAPAAEA